MKKQLALLLCASGLLASDPITLDSMFKNQHGLRSITTLQSISGSSSNSYSTYPDLTSSTEGTYYTDVKIISLNQTLMYDFTKNFDGILSATASVKRKEYIDLTSMSYQNKNSNDFDSLWIGGVYSFDTILGSFKPDLTLQAALKQNERYSDKTVSSTLKSYSARASFKNYSDPVISTLFVGTIINSSKKIGGHDIDNGNSFMAGFNTAIILSPKISLDLGMEQRYQTEQKVDGAKASSSATISTLSLGATYSLSSKSSFAVSGSMGGSSKSPDSILAVSLWQKF